MKKKGFTLIELLAVIVILAIIALIATPLVLKYIEKSRIESFKVSVENIKDSAIKYVASEQLSGTVTYPVILDVKDLDFKGKEDYTGKVIVYKDGSIKEYVQKENYRSSSGSLINGKSNPFLKVKEGKTAVIDEENKLVYSFWNNEKPNSKYIKMYLTLEILQSIFEVENGSLEFEQVKANAYSTGTKLIVKNEQGNIYEEYQIVIFGDVTSDGLINNSDALVVHNHIEGESLLTGAQLKAADLNFDGLIVEEEAGLIMKIFNTELNYNQITNKITYN